MSRVSDELKPDLKLKIIVLNRHLFPELASDLEKNGQLQPILVDEDGYVHDGAKRVILCGIQQLLLCEGRQASC